MMVCWPLQTHIDSNGAATVIPLWCTELDQRSGNVRLGFIVVVVIDPLYYSAPYFYEGECRFIVGYECNLDNS